MNWMIVAIVLYAIELVHGATGLLVDINSDEETKMWPLSHKMMLFVFGMLLMLIVPLLYIVMSIVNVFRLVTDRGQ